MLSDIKKIRTTIWKFKKEDLITPAELISLQVFLRSSFIKCRIISCLYEWLVLWVCLYTLWARFVCIRGLFIYLWRSFSLCLSIACVNDIIQKLLYKSVSIKNSEESQWKIQCVPLIIISNNKDPLLADQLFNRTLTYIQDQNKNSYLINERT